MRMPTKPGRLLTHVVRFASVVLVAACAGDATSPAASSTTKAIEATSTFRPTEANRALVGISDGTYQVTFNANKDQVIGTGANRLVIPGGAICDMKSSGYGPDYWDKPCESQKGQVTLTIVVKNSQSVHPQMNFYPAMRFNPDKVVQLYIYAPRVTEQSAKDWWMFYCNDSKQCIDESLTDSSLQTYIDYSASVLFRRVKHFSGYVVAERTEEAEALQ
jgi:hypothetical protein